MDTAVAAAVITGGTALVGSGIGLYLQARGQRIAIRITEANAINEARQDTTDTVLISWKRIADAQERRIDRLEKAEQNCLEELRLVRADLKAALNANRP